MPPISVYSHQNNPPNDTEFLKQAIAQGELTLPLKKRKMSGKLKIILVQLKYYYMKVFYLKVKDHKEIVGNIIDYQHRNHKIRFFF